MVEHIQRGSETHYLSYISSPDGLVAMHISDDDGRDEMKYVLTDYLGTIYALVDDGAQSTDDALYYSFNAWGERRELQAYDGSLTAPLFSDPADYITSRGYTGHEHIDAFDLINMNGRAYDPVVGAFLSPDPYVQAPDMPQNLNRYAYCLNNPLKYSDPSGEFFIEAMMIGAFTNIFFQGVTGNLHNLGDALFAGGIGALSGAAAASVSAGVGSVLMNGSFGAGVTGACVVDGISGFWHGFLTGAAGGGSAGFIMGSGYAWKNGASLFEGLGQGLSGALYGGIMGGVINGISSGINAMKNDLRFWDGASVTTDYVFIEGYPQTYQEYAHDCTEKVIEAVDKSYGGDISAAAIRDVFGTDPNEVGLYTESAFKLYAKEARRGFRWMRKFPYDIEQIIFDEVKNGSRIGVSIDTGLKEGHAVGIKSVYKKTVTKPFGLPKTTYRIGVMDPAVRISHRHFISKFELLKAKTMVFIN